MVAQVRQWAGVIPAKEIARRLGISKSLLTNRAAKYRISLRANRTVFTPAVEAEIMRLVGTVQGRTIAERMGLSYKSLCDWAKRRGVKFRVQSDTFIATYARLKTKAQKLGLRFSWRSPNSGISLWIAVAEGLNPRQAEALLSRTSNCLDTADRAYDRGVRILGLNNAAHSLGAAVTPVGIPLHRSPLVAPQLIGISCPRPVLG